MKSNYQWNGATIPIDPNGDLTLIVGHPKEARAFRVSSKTLSLASPVWRAMFSPQNNFKEASPDNEEITFPKDSSQAVFVVLLAAHLLFQDIPQKVEFTELVDLCVVSDKYDCISLLQPWLTAWMAPFRELVEEDGFEEWALIAWVAGDEDTFRRTTDRIVFTCKTNQKKQCLTAAGGILDDVLPPVIIGK